MAGVRESSSVKLVRGGARPGGGKGVKGVAASGENREWGCEGIGNTMVSRIQSSIVRLYPGLQHAFGRIHETADHSWSPSKLVSRNTQVPVPKQA